MSGADRRRRRGLLALLALLGLHLAVVLHQVVCELLDGRHGEHVLLPQVGRQVAVRLGDGGVRGLGCREDTQEGSVGGRGGLLSRHGGGGAQTMSWARGVMGALYKQNRTGDCSKNFNFQ